MVIACVCPTTAFDFRSSSPPPPPPPPPYPPITVVYTQTLSLHYMNHTHTPVFLWTVGPLPLPPKGFFLPAFLEPQAPGLGRLSMGCEITNMLAISYTLKAHILSIKFEIQIFPDNAFTPYNRLVLYIYHYQGNMTFVAHI